MSEAANQESSEKKTKVDQFLCSICLDYFIAPVTSRCLHSFCAKCVKNKYSCPKCETPDAKFKFNEEIMQMMEVVKPEHITKHSIEIETQLRYFFVVKMFKERGYDLTMDCDIDEHYLGILARICKICISQSSSPFATVWGSSSSFEPDTKLLEKLKHVLFHQEYAIGYHRGIVSSDIQIIEFTNTCRNSQQVFYVSKTIKTKKRRINQEIDQQIKENTNLKNASLRSFQSFITTLKCNRAGSMGLQMEYQLGFISMSSIGMRACVFTW